MSCVYWVTDLLFDNPSLHYAEVATRDALYKKLFWKTLQYSQENTSAGVSF